VAARINPVVAGPVLGTSTIHGTSFRYVTNFSIYLSSAASASKFARRKSVTHANLQARPGSGSSLEQGVPSRSFGMLPTFKEFIYPSSSHDAIALSSLRIPTSHASTAQYNSNPWLHKTGLRLGSHQAKIILHPSLLHPDPQLP
jgi:hypothetical protein